MDLYSAFGNQSGHCDVKSAKKVRQFQRNVRLREILTRKIFGMPFEFKQWVCNFVIVATTLQCNYSLLLRAHFKGAPKQR